MERKIRVVVADDQRFARMYVEMYIAASPDYELIASLPSAEDALSYLEEHQVDLIILDIVMERGIDGLTAAAEIKRRCPGTRIILATSLADFGWMEKAKSIGVESFWYKEYSTLPLTEIMDRTMAGESVYLDKPPEVYLGKLPVSDLTPRQKILLSYLVKGLTTKEIADRMDTSVHTAKAHLDAVMEATGIHSRTELAVRASGLGLDIGTT